MTNPATWIDRACVACPHVWTGDLACPACGEPGEPLKSTDERARFLHDDDELRFRNDEITSPNDEITSPNDEILLSICVNDEIQ